MYKSLKVSAQKSGPGRCVLVIGFFLYWTANQEVTTAEQEAEKDDQLPTDLNCVRMPPTMRKRGRPKGLEKTVIGLARKRQHFSKLPYVRRPAEEKTDGIPYSAEYTRRSKHQKF